MKKVRYAKKKNNATTVLSGKAELEFLVNYLNWIILGNVELLFEIEFTAELEMLVSEVRMVKMTQM